MVQPHQTICMGILVQPTIKVLALVYVQKANKTSIFRSRFRSKDLFQIHPPRFLFPLESKSPKNATLIISPNFAQEGEVGK